MADKPAVLVDLTKAQGHTAGTGAYISGLATALSEYLAVEGLVFLGPRPAFPFPVRVLRPNLPVVSAVPAVRLARALQVPLVTINRVPLLLAPELAVPIILDVTPLLFPETHPRVRGILERQTYRVAARARLLITISETSRSDIIRHLHVDPARLCVARPGRLPVEPDDGRDGEHLRRFGIRGPYILALGTIEPRKNLTLIVEALKAMSPPPSGGADGQEGQLQFVIAGEAGWKYGPILEAMRPLEKAGRLRRIGFVTNIERAALYRGAVCLVFPSLYEGFGLPILEAMTYGTPVLASTAPACREVLGDAGIALDPHDPAPWASAIQQIAGNASLRARLAEAGRARAQQFTWSRSIISLVNRLGAAHVPRAA